MGIPVIAIGVPTVVPSNVIVYDTLDYLFKHIDYLKENEDTSKLSYYKKNYIEKLKGREVNSIDKERLLGSVEKCPMEVVVIEEEKIA